MKEFGCHKYPCIIEEAKTIKLVYRSLGIPNALYPTPIYWGRKGRGEGEESGVKSDVFVRFFFTWHLAVGNSDMRCTCTADKPNHLDIDETITRLKTANCRWHINMLGPMLLYSSLQLDFDENWSANDMNTG